MSDINEFIDGLELDYEAKQFGSQWVIYLPDSDAFGDIFTQLSTNKELQVDPSSMSTDDLSVYIFTDGYFQATVTANFQKDIYKVVFDER